MRCLLPLTYLVSTVALCLPALVGCADEEAMDEPIKRPAHVINEQTSHTTAHADAPTPVETVTHFRTTDTLPEIDARHLLLVGDTLYATGPTSLMVLDPNEDVFTTLVAPGAGPIVDLSTTTHGNIAIARADAVQLVSTDGQIVQTWSTGTDVIQSVTSLDGAVYVGTNQGLGMLDGSGLSMVAAAGISVRDLETVGDVVYMATEQGVRTYDPNGPTEQSLTAPDFLPDDHVRALRLSAEADRIVVGTATGVAVLSHTGAALEQLTAGMDGLPTSDVLAVASTGGELIIGHEVGATVWNDEHKDYYSTNRWILNDRVNDVALQSDGTRWIATQDGVSRISFESYTLEQRAEIHEANNEWHWRMDGFVADTAFWEDAWDRSVPASHHDHDNDGLWTEMQIAGWCFAYASTGQATYYEDARRAMDVMQLQFDVPAATFEATGKSRGFITRSLVRSDEGEIFDNKATQSNWHLQEYEGELYYWKDDTSSDEYAGHFFGIPVFYDLCAKTEPEREAIRERVHEAMSYIVDHDYRLIDLDGEPTLHGHWTDLASAADGLNECLVSGAGNCFESFGGGGWLNSIEVLGMLLASWHITGDGRFYDEYERLAVKERYGEMVPVKESTATITSRKVANHSDHELASLAYYTLLRYEPNPERRAVWIQSIRDFYAYEKDERNPLEIAVMASAVPDANVADAAQTLFEMPLDWRKWKYDNGHRQDNELDVLDRHGNEQFKHMFPYDEIRTMKWNGNPYNVEGGSDGTSQQAPWPYLLPYWMMRYYGAIQ